MVAKAKTRKTKAIPRKATATPSDVEVARMDLTSDGLTTWLDNLLTETQVCKKLGIKLSTLRTWRCRGKGPRGIKSGRKFLYRPDSVQSYLLSQENY
jgi:hypothetical protein